MAHVSDERWADVVTCLVALNAEQADAVLGGELMLDLADAVATASGEPLEPHAILAAANALLHRRT